MADKSATKMLSVLKESIAQLVDDWAHGKVKGSVCDQIEDHLEAFTFIKSRLARRKPKKKSSSHDSDSAEDTDDAELSQ